MYAGKIRFRGALFALILALAIALATVAVQVGARAASIGQLQQRIYAGRSRISGLSGVVGAQTHRLGTIDAGIAGLQRRLDAIQVTLEARIAQLRRTQALYVRTRTHLLALEAYEAHAQTVLARELVGAYETQRPDLISVILQAHGFQDLLERISFMVRVQQQDAHVVANVRAARRAVAAEAIRLGALQVREQALERAVLAQRQRLAGAQLALVAQQQAVTQTRSLAAAKLASVRAQVASLQQQLAAAQAAAARAAAQAAAQQAAQQQAAQQPAGQSGASAGTPAVVPAGTPVGAGGFTFPLPKGSAAPPGSWSDDDGVDISAPGGTPEYAVCSGTIVLHGIGGFGPWAPVLHCDSAVGGYSYVYYGHAGPAYQLPVGTHVGAGQVMSSIGPGIVGISTGPHVEMGFCDASGNPLGPGTAGTMHALLLAAYGG